MQSHAPDRKSGFMSCSGRRLMEIAGLEPTPLERPAKLPLLLYPLPEGVCTPPFDQAPATYLLALSSC